VFRNGERQAFFRALSAALPRQVLEDFAVQYRKRIGLPFIIQGIHPNTFQTEKFNLLVKAGLNHVHMGIQSGSSRVLNFYNRKTSLNQVVKSANTLSKAAKEYDMAPPIFDFIIDNPYETKEDVVATLKLLNELERPFSLNLYGLVIYKQTAIHDFFEKHPEYFNADLYPAQHNYFGTNKTYEDILAYLISQIRLPEFIFKNQTGRIGDMRNQNKLYPKSFFLLRSVFLFRRALRAIRGYDFCVVTGRWLYVFWKLNVFNGRRKFKALMKKTRETYRSVKAMIVR